MPFPLIHSSIPPVPAALPSTSVGVAGWRLLPPSAMPQVFGVVRSIFASGRILAVGCATRADHFALVAALQLLAPSIPEAAALLPTGDPAAASRREALALAVAVAHAVALSPALAAHLAVYPVSAFPPTGRAAFARRTEAMVSAVAASGEGAGLVAFPGKACPSGVSPTRRWRSAKGSGTWGACALAAGLELPLVVYLPDGVALPAWWGVWVPAGEGVWAGGWRLVRGLL